jgi:hypothetical protein
MRAISYKGLLGIWYCYSALSQLILIYPVYNIHFVASGLSVMDVAALQGIWMLPILLLEIPSGILADRFGRKGVIVFGYIAKTATFIVWLLFPGFAGFALGFALWGIQEAFASGAQDALIYDALRKSGKESEYEKVCGRANALGKLSTMLALVIGGFAYSLSSSLALILSSVAMLACILLALFFPECPIADGEEGHPTVRSILSDGLREILVNRGFLALGSFAAVAGTAYGLLDEFDQFFGLSAGVVVALIGVWGAGRFLVESIGAALAPRLSRFAKGRWALYVLSGIAGLFIAAAVLFRSPWTLPFYFLAYGVFSAAEVLTSARLQAEIPSSSRATLLSLVSLATNAVALPLVGVFGLIFASRGIGAAMLFFAVIATIPIAAYLFRAKLLKNPRG